MSGNNLIFKTNSDAFNYSLEFPLTVGLNFNVALVTENLGDGNYELLINIAGEKDVKIADDDESSINYKVGDFVIVGHTFDEETYFILGKLKPELDIETNNWIRDNE